MRKYVWICLSLVLVARSPVRADLYSAGDGPHRVGTIKEVWNDAKRDRAVPVRIDYPTDLARQDTVPVIVFSHGLGGTRDTYADYGKHWASYGYVVVFPQHAGSDSGVIGHGMAKMLMGEGDLQAFKDRIDDVHFVIDDIEQLQAGKMTGAEDQKLAGHLNLNEIGMAGHSFGAFTTQAIVGQAYAFQGKTGNFQDKRVKAGIAMSGSGSKTGDQDSAFGSIKIPMYYMTGSKDQIGLIQADTRRLAFDHSTFPETYLVTFEGGTHMTFVPAGRMGATPEKEVFQKYIRESTTAFWDAYLKGDKTAQHWLDDEFKGELGKTGVFEEKIK